MRPTAQVGQPAPDFTAPAAFPGEATGAPPPPRQPHRLRGPLARLLLVSPRLHHRLPHRDCRPLRPPGRVQ